MQDHDRDQPRGRFKTHGSAWQTAFHDRHGGRPQRSIRSIHARFRTTDGDGVGDLRASHSRLSYLAGLGVDAIWLSPIFRSPMKDFGYDISNYIDIDPMFGTMADFDTLLAAAHEQGLKAAARSRTESHLGSTPVVRRKPVIEARTPDAIGISGAIPRRMEGRPTIGYRNSAGSAWQFDATLPDSTTITPSLPSSRI